MARKRHPPSNKTDGMDRTDKINGVFFSPSVHPASFFVFSAVVVSVLAFWPLGALAGEVTIDPDRPVLHVSPLLEYLVLPAPASPEEFPPPPEQGDFQPIKGPDIRFGLTDRSTAYWFRLTINNPLDVENRQFLKVDNPRLNTVVCYVPKPEGGFTTYHAGTDHAFSHYAQPWPQPTFRIITAPHSQTTLYLCIRNKGWTEAHVYLWQTSPFLEHMARWILILGLFYGVLIAIVLHNILISLRLHGQPFFYHALFVLACIGYQLSFHGTAHQFLWRNAQWWTDRSVFFFIGFGICLAFLFTRSFLNTASLAPRLDKILAAMALLSLAIPLGKTTEFLWVNVYTHVLSLIAPPLLIAAGWISHRRGNRSARAFLMGWGVMLTGAIVIGLWGLNLLPDHFIFRNLFHIGFIFIPLLQSFALMDHIRHLEQRNQQELERQVAERTHELQEALDNVKTLRGFIPICARCKKIRDDAGYWNSIEAYVRKHSDADFTHGICPECTRVLYGIELDLDRKPGKTTTRTQSTVPPVLSEEDENGSQS